jgi:hypothetical protein
VTQDETYSALMDSACAMGSAFRRLAERTDGASNGKCTLCGAGRATSGWDFGRTNGVGVPEPCTNERCLSHNIRAILSPET